MSTPRRGPRGSVGALIEEVRFARDSPVEGEGFDLSFCVFFRTIQQIVRIFLDFEVENEVENPTT